MDVENDVNAAGEVGPDQVEHQTSQLSPEREVLQGHQSTSSTHKTIMTGNTNSSSSPAGNGKHPPEPRSGNAGGNGSEDLAVQVIDLEVLPSDSDDGVRHHIDQIGAKLNIKHVMGCLRLLADLLRVAGNVVATDASQLVKVQELQFEVIKLCDAVSLMLQSDQSGANNILEKLKIAYLYLQDGFPDFAKTDIEVISKDVKSMEEATQKCLGKIKAAKSSEETVLNLAKSKLMARLIKVPQPPPPPSPPSPKKTPPPPRDPPQPRHVASWWQVAYDIGINALLQMGCQAARELTGLNSLKQGFFSDVTDNQVMISLLWSWKPNQPYQEDRKDREENKILTSSLIFMAPALTVYAIASKASVMRVLQTGFGFGIPALCLHFRGVSPRPPTTIDINKESLSYFRRVCAIGVVPGIGGCICHKLNVQMFVRTLGIGLQLIENNKALLDSLGPFSRGVGFFIITYIVKQWRSFVPSSVKNLPRLDSASGSQPKEPPSVDDERDELNEDLRVKRDEWAKAVDDAYTSLLEVKVIEKSLPLLDDMTIVLDYATTLVNNWYTECKEIVEPNMQQNIDRAEGLSEEDKHKYWDSLFFKKEVKSYYERWRALQVFCEKNRPALKSARQRAEGHYTENLYPREAVKKAWELAAEEPDEDIRALVEERRRWLKAKASCDGKIEMAVPQAMVARARAALRGELLV